MRQRGSITVFASLSLMLVAQLIFTFLEGAHCQEVAKCARMNTESALESVFADYCTPLWENYHLLGFVAETGDGAFALNNREAQVRRLTQESLGTGSHLLHMDMTDVEFSSYLLMSDQAGRVFEEAVCAYMKQNVGYEAAKTLYGSYEAVLDLDKKYKGSDESIENARQALEEAKQQAEEQSGMQVDKGQTQTAFLYGENSLAGRGMTMAHRNTTQKSSKRKKETKKKKPEKQTQINETESADEEEENLLDTIAEAKQKGVLTLVLQQDSKLSDCAIKLDQTVSHRSLRSGTGEMLPDSDWYQKVLLNQYLINYLGCYTDKLDHQSLNYEMEYVLAGKEKDSENLKIVVEELLAIREALNMASIMAMPDKQTEAMTLALTIAGATVNPLIIEAVKYGILAAWAFVESVLDLRTLLAGGKIAMVKSELEWTSNLSALPELLSGWSCAKENPQGMDYKSCLGLLLYFHGEQQLSMRAMDVEETAIQSLEGYDNFQMDHLVCDADICASYGYKPAFLSFVHLLKDKTGQFQIQNKARYSYFEKGGA